MTDEGGPALFRLVRFWSRRWARGVAADAGVGASGSSPQHVLVVDAVDALGPDDATVGGLAARLGLDHSGASRMVDAAARAGYVERGRSAADGRRSVLALTSAGWALLGSAHAWQRETFDRMTAHWAEPDRAAFAGYLARLAREAGA